MGVFPSRQSLGVAGSGPICWVLLTAVSAPLKRGEQGWGLWGQAEAALKVARPSCPGPSWAAGWHTSGGLFSLPVCSRVPTQSCCPTGTWQLSADETWASPGSPAASVMSTCLGAFTAPAPETRPRPRQKGPFLGKYDGGRASYLTVPPPLQRVT